MNFFKKILLFSICFLILMSSFALIGVHSKLSEHSFSITPEGLEFYLSSLGAYKTLFAATVTTIAAYFGFHRATDANIQKLKQDRFTEWKTGIEVRALEIEKNDSIMKREFVRLRYSFFEKVYDLNFKFNNKEQITSVFTSIFENAVPTFERQNERCIAMGGIYQDKQQSYSFDSFQFLFFGGVSEIYADATKDLHALYVSKLPSDRLIDGSCYKAAVIGGMSRKK